MASSKAKLYKETFREIEKIRNKNKREYAVRKDIAYDKCPELYRLEREKSELATDFIKLVLKDPQNKENIKAELQQKQKQMESIKDELLRKANIDPNSLNMHYNCSECEDEGRIGNETCRCFKQIYLDKIYTQSNLKMQIETENFGQFNIDYYSKEYDEKYSDVPQENMKRVLQKAHRYVQNYTNYNGKKEVAENLFLYGRPGLGKTYLCNCIAGGLLENNVPVLYLTAHELFTTLEEKRFNSNNFMNKFSYENGNEVDEKPQWDNELVDIDVLIIDDLGTETRTQYTVAELFSILNERKIMNKSTIISTNWNIDEVYRNYSERIGSRIVGGFQFLQFFGKDVRAEKRR